MRRAAVTTSPSAPSAGEPALGGGRFATLVSVGMIFSLSIAVPVRLFAQSPEPPEIEREAIQVPASDAGEKPAESEPDAAEPTAADVPDAETSADADDPQPVAPEAADAKKRRAMEADIRRGIDRLKENRDPYGVPVSTDATVIERVTVDDVGNRLLVLIQASKALKAFVFERNDPPSLFIQFLSTPVYTSAPPIQVVGVEPLTEIRYGYTSFHDVASLDRKRGDLFPIDYIELRLQRPVFFHMQQEGWVVVVGLDRTTAKVEVPELDFRFDTAQYVGAANLAQNPRTRDFVEIALANSRLLAVARDEVDLAETRVFEAKRSLWPSVTARASATRGEEVNPFPSENFEGFEATTFKRDEYGVQINQPIYQSGRLWNAYRQSKLNRLMALENVRKQAQDLAFEVKKALFTLQKNQTIRRIRQELVAQGEALKEMVANKFRLELTSQSEVLNVTAQADQASYQLVSDEQDVTLARLVLISLLNQNDPVPDPVPGELSAARLSFNVESIISWAKDHRPDVRIARLNAELARYNWLAARADGRIKLDASGFYGRAGAAFAEEEDDYELREAWNVGLRVSRVFWGNTLRGNFTKENAAPDLGQSFITESEQKSVELSLLDALPGRSDARQAELQYERAKAELVEASRKAEFEVRETYYNLEKSARQLDAVREDLNFRKKDLEITREKVKLGLAETSQLMAAEVAYAESKVTEQQALSAYNVALADMDRVAGAEVVRK